VVAVMGLVAPLVLLVAYGQLMQLLLLTALAALAGAAARYGLGRDMASLRSGPTPGTSVGPATRPVLLMNPRSGGGKVERFHLVEEAERRGIEPIVLAPGDDLRRLAEQAVTRGADVIGMAGGDGSQALVAGVAADHGVAFVCVPAGTRNHLAMDLGLDRDDVVGALDAFGAAVERSIDLGLADGRVFVNNATMGLYAKIVQSPKYRDRKLGTALDLLPGLLGPHATPFDLRFTGPDGTEHHAVHIILVSNNGTSSAARRASGPDGASTPGPSASSQRDCGPPATSPVLRGCRLSGGPAGHPAGRSGPAPPSVHRHRAMADRRRPTGNHRAVAGHHRRCCCIARARTRISSLWPVRSQSMITLPIWGL
jgi:hypothetical protein